MAKVTISVYSDLPRGLGSGLLPIAPPDPLYKNSFGTTGQSDAMPDNARFVRIATDTAICVRRNGAGADGNDDLQFANTAEFWGVSEGAIVSWTTA